MKKKERIAELERRVIALESELAMARSFMPPVYVPTTSHPTPELDSIWVIPQQFDPYRITWTGNTGDMFGNQPGFYLSTSTLAH